MAEQRCGTCRYSSPPEAGDYFSVCRYFTPDRISEPYPFWFEEDSLGAGISLKDDGGDCPCYELLPEDS